MSQRRHKNIRFNFFWSITFWSIDQLNVMYMNLNRKECYEGFQSPVFDYIHHRNYSEFSWAFCVRFSSLYIFAILNDILTLHFALTKSHQKLFFLMTAKWPSSRTQAHESCVEQWNDEALLCASRVKTGCSAKTALYWRVEHKIHRANNTFSKWRHNYPS